MVASSAQQNDPGACFSMCGMSRSVQQLGLAGKGTERNGTGHRLVFYGEWWGTARMKILLDNATARAYIIYRSALLRSF